MPNKTCSFRDILKASWLKGLNEIDLLSIDRDDEVNKVLEAIGIETAYGVEYYACLHRDLTGLVAVGFMAAGSVTINRDHLNSAYASIEDRLIASAYSDPSLTRELGTLRGLQRSYEQDHALESESDVIGAKSRTYVEPLSESSAISQQIAELNDLCFHIRGNSHGPSGALKTQSEYKQYNEERKLERGLV